MLLREVFPSTIMQLFGESDWFWSCNPFKNFNLSVLFTLKRIRLKIMIVILSFENIGWDSLHFIYFSFLCQHFACIRDVKSVVFLLSAPRKIFSAPSRLKIDLLIKGRLCSGPEVVIRHWLLIAQSIFKTVWSKFLYRWSEFSGVKSGWNKIEVLTLLS